MAKREGITIGDFQATRNEALLSRMGREVGRLTITPEGALPTEDEIKALLSAALTAEIVNALRGQFVTLAILHEGATDNPKTLSSQDLLTTTGRVIKEIFDECSSPTEIGIYTHAKLPKKAVNDSDPALSEAS